MAPPASGFALLPIVVGRHSKWKETLTAAAVVVKGHELWAEKMGGTAYETTR